MNLSARVAGSGRQELESSVNDISSKVRRRDTILSSRGATGSRVRDRSFELRPTFTPLQFCLEGEGEPALGRSLVFTPLDQIVDTQVKDLAFLGGGRLRSEVRSVQDLITLGDCNSLRRLMTQPGATR